MIEFRNAAIGDLKTLVYWDQQEHVIAAIPNDNWNWEYEIPRTPEWRELLIAELAGKPIGFVQIIDPAIEETHYWGEIEFNKRAIDIWIGEKENLGQGYGTQMMELSISRCFSNPLVSEIIIDPLESNKKAIQFYKRLGFEFLEKRVFRNNHCEILILRRTKWMK